LNNNNKKR